MPIDERIVDIWRRCLIVTAAVRRVEVEHAAPVSELGLVYGVLRVVLAAQVQHQEPWGRPELAVQSARKGLPEGNLFSESCGAKAIALVLHVGQAR